MRQPRWTRRRGGFNAAEFRLTITLSEEIWESIQKAARQYEEKPRAFLVLCALEGIYRNIEDTDEEEGER